MGADAFALQRNNQRFTPVQPQRRRVVTTDFRFFFGPSSSGKALRFLPSLSMRLAGWSSAIAILKGVGVQRSKQKFLR